eukprot:5128776-Prymnesium_polylepis.1
MRNCRPSFVGSSSPSPWQQKMARNTCFSSWNSICPSPSVSNRPFIDSLMSSNARFDTFQTALAVSSITSTHTVKRTILLRSRNGLAPMMLLSEWNFEQKVESRYQQMSTLNPIVAREIDFLP